MRYGWLGLPTEESKRPVGCVTEMWILWLGAAGMFASAFLRVYRSHSVLLWHNGFMWPVPVQLGITMMPFVLTPVSLTSGAGSLVFDEETNECERDSEMPEAIAVGFIALLAAATAALTCRLQAVRFQVIDSFECKCYSCMRIDGRGPTVLPRFSIRTWILRDERVRGMAEGYAFLLHCIVAVIVFSWFFLPSLRPHVLFGRLFYQYAIGQQRACSPSDPLHEKSRATSHGTTSVPPLHSTRKHPRCPA